MKLTKYNTTTRNYLLQKIIVFTCLFFSLKAAAQPKQEAILNLRFNIKAGTAAVVPGHTYTNPFGEDYTVQKFRFYITQVELKDSTDMSVQFFPDDYFLIDAGDTATQTIAIPLSIKHITSVSFMIGVDSSANVGGTQQGALDPANGMFWTWNTGYIMLKLQATSPAAKVPANSFTYDVGGFKTGENVARKVGFFIRHGINQAVHNIIFNVDINKIFEGDHSIKIAEHPMCHEPGALAMQLADNYGGMFSIQQVTK